MEEFNTLLADTSTFFPNRLGEQAITQGYCFRFGTSYQVSKYIDFGLYGSYQFGASSGTRQGFTIDPFILDTLFYQLESTLRTEAIGVGATTAFHFHALPKWKLPLLFDVNLSLGLGFSNAKESVYNVSNNSVSRSLYHNSRDAQSTIGINLGYPIFHKSHEVHIGLSAGYQYFRTQALKSGGSTAINGIQGKTVHLDFSGLFIGIYCKLIR